MTWQPIDSAPEEKALAEYAQFCRERRAKRKGRALVREGGGR